MVTVLNWWSAQWSRCSRQTKKVVKVMVTVVTLLKTMFKGVVTMVKPGVQRLHMDIQAVFF